MTDQQDVFEVLVEQANVTVGYLRGIAGGLPNLPDVVAEGMRLRADSLRDALDAVRGHES